MKAAESKGVIADLLSAWRVCGSPLSGKGLADASKSFTSALEKTQLVDALVAAKQMVEISREARESQVQAYALVLLANVHLEMGRPREALGAVGQGWALQQPSGALLASLLSTHCLASCAKKDFDEALRAAAQIVSEFRQKKDVEGEAAGTLLLAQSYLAKESPKAADRAAEKALGLYQRQKNSAGEQESKAISEKAKAMLERGDVPEQSTSSGKPARMVLDPSDGIVVLEIQETSSAESLDQAIAILQSQCDKVKAIVLVIEGVPKFDENATCPGLRSGAFIMGLRSAGAPIVCCASGLIQGYVWSLMMQMDYKIATADSSFVMPVNAPTSIMKKMLSSTHVGEMCLKAGPMNAVDMMGVGLIHQCISGKDKAKAAAMEFACHLQEFPMPIKHLLGQGDYHADYMQPKHPTSRVITAGWF